LELSSELNNKIFSRFPDLLSIIGEVSAKKLQDLKDQTEKILDTLMEAEINTVFTNDAKYLSQRDDLLAVIFLLIFRKLLTAIQMMAKNFL